MRPLHASNWPRRLRRLGCRPTYPLRGLFLSLLWVSLLSAGNTSLAAPPSDDETRGDQEEIAALPPRELKFVLEDKPWIVKLDEHNPGAADKNYDQLAKQFPYAAIVRGFAPLLAISVRSREEFRSRPLTAGDLKWLAESGASAASTRLRALAAGFFYYGGGLEFSFQSRLVPDYDDRIRPPPGKHVAVFNSFEQVFGRLGRIDPLWSVNFGDITDVPGVARAPLQEYAFLAGSVEDAKQLAKDFLDVYDRDFLPRAAEIARQEKTKLITSRDEIAPQLEESERQDAAAQRELEGVEELEQGAVSDLKVKRALLKVELAGVEARLVTIEAKLKKMDSRDTTGARLVEFKVAADIDLASLAAQRKVLDAMIDGQRRRAEVDQLRNKKLRPLQQRASRTAHSIQRCDQILADLIPFQLVDDSVIIRPVKFEVAAEKE